MAIVELHRGPLVIPTTSLSWHGTEKNELSRVIEENFGIMDLITPSEFTPCSIDIKYGRNCEIMYHSAKYGGGFGLIPNGDLDGFFFKFPKQCTTIITIGHDQSVIRHGEAAAFRGPTLKKVMYENKFEESQLSFSASYCIERLSTLLERPILKSIIFEPKLSINSSSLSKFAELAHFLCQSDFGVLIQDLPNRATRLSTLVVDIALSTWPHSYSEDLQRRPPSIAPRNVKASIEYIRDHPFEVTSPEYLAHTLGVSLRSLQYSFKNFTGQTISEYQKELRLSGARKEIIDTNQPIKDVAQKWGFFSSGRFSAYFREAYGVFPSELKRGKQI